MPITSLLPDTDDLFDDHGELVIMARLASAAYALHSGEKQGGGINNAPTATSVADYGFVDDTLQLLTDTDLPGLGLEADPGSDFEIKGLSEGIYTNENAAALLARSDDALFIAFRGTNDGLFSPDSGHWLNKDAHYALFAEMMPALIAYVEANPEIDTIYLTGHSLGGAMVEAATQALVDAGLSGVGLKGVTFASLGYPDSDDIGDLVADFVTDNDIVGPVSNPQGDENTFEDGLFSGLSSESHSMAFYRGIVMFLQEEGVDLKTLSPAKGKDLYDDVLFVAAVDGDGYSFGAAKDSLTGDSSNEVILGGAKGDKLKGKNGDDLILGGSSKDKIFGGKGLDELRGGGGKDKFFFDERLAKNHDVIADFQRNKDTFKLDEDIFEAIGGKLKKNEFIVGKKAKDDNDHLVYHKAKGKLFYDEDGDGSDGKELFAKVEKKLKLSVDDFDMV
ncbi:MAG: hypothetical protein GY798_16100 [Hyphomicrobiales bacterium]|nr:hypothetical protein [Hyphomicrobiales bacterium]